MRLVLVMLAAVALVAVTSCGSSSSSSGSSTSEDASSGSDLTFTNDNVDRLMSDADAYKDAPVDGLVGHVFRVDRQDGRTGVQMWVDSDERDQVIVIFDDASFDVDEGDYLRVTGTVYDLFEGENAFGATLEVPRILGEEGEHVDFTAMHPAHETLGPQRATLEDVRYTIAKVEFAEEQTRIYVEAENLGDYEADVDTAPSVVSQGRQVEQEVSFEDLPELSYELSPGARTDGVLVYPAMSPDDLEIRFTGHDPHSYDEITVSFRYPEPRPSSSDRSDSSADAGVDQTNDRALTACDENIELDPEHTTCPFAQNAFYEYFMSGQSDSIVVWSPALDRHVDMTCASDGSDVSCSNDAGAYLEFAQAAVDAYTQKDAREYAASHDLG